MLRGNAGAGSPETWHKEYAERESMGGSTITMNSGQRLGGRHAQEPASLLGSRERAVDDALLLPTLIESTKAET